MKFVIFLYGAGEYFWRSDPDLKRRVRNHFDIPFYSRVTPDNVKSSILRKLPINSTLEEVNQFIEKQNLGKDNLTPCFWINKQDAKSYNWEQDQYLTPFENVQYRIICRIRHKDELIVLGFSRIVDYEIVFFIDSQNKLRLVHVKEDFTTI